MGSSSQPPPRIRLGILPDYMEEGWASMDLTAAMTSDLLVSNHAQVVEVTSLIPSFRSRLSKFPRLANTSFARNMDRLINRSWDYPRAVKSQIRHRPFDVFHVMDHSYSQLAHALPAERVVITCHDLDTFRCVLNPANEPRPLWFRAMTQRILDGFRKAAAVACDSDATRRAILDHELLPEHKLMTIPLGIAPEFQDQANPRADAEATRLLGESGPTELLHVGSTIARKRIDVLLDTFAIVRKHRPDARLIKVGGSLTPDQIAHAESLGLMESIKMLPFLDRSVVAAIYRRSALVLQPSEAEGFGLPLVEAMACGAVVIASDIQVLREVGGTVTIFCPVANPQAWAAIALELLEERSTNPQTWRQRQAVSRKYSLKYQWSNHVAHLVRLYQQVVRQSDCESDNRSYVVKTY